MTTVAAPRRVEATIAMDDGVRLAATLYLPDPELGPQPCILEALPYRKDDLTSSYRPEYTRLRDQHAYAVCRLDLRGTGSSGGDATDEYPLREQRDLAAVLTWLAAQDWCDGNIGMYGTSYSGFNSLQMACERPPELRAVIAIYASDDRYTDDVHYRGGMLRLLDLVDYCHYMTPMNALPPVPRLWGEAWRDEWRRRVAGVEPWLLTWLEHQRDDGYWRHGSVRRDYTRIRCPVMLVAGWADGYRNNTFRTVAQLRRAGVPHRLLAGPWAHASTSTALPGPRIDLVPEMVAWWDRWLRGADGGGDDDRGGRGADGGGTAKGGGLEHGQARGDDGTQGWPGAAEPVLTCFVRSSTRPEPDLDTCNGEWVREDWPCARVASRELPVAGRPPYLVQPAVGVDAWIDCAGHLPYGQSLDQRYDDAASLTWEWDADEATLLGHPAVRLSISADRPVAFCSVKLCDVFPDGTSALVSRGSLNLTHRSGHQEVRALVPGQVYEVSVELDACAYRFEPGQRMRLSLAGVDWPNTAAPPEPLTLTVHSGTLALPCWVGPSPYTAPCLAPGGEPQENPEEVRWTVGRDMLARVTSAAVDHGSTYDVPYGATATEHYAGQVSIDERTFGQRAQATATFTIRWPEATVTSDASMTFAADAVAYDVTIDLVAREGEQVVGRRSWHRRIPRDLA